jgi:hypothetical protein
MRWLPILAALSLSAYAVSLPKVQFIRPPAIVREGEPVVWQIRVLQDPDNRLLKVQAFDGPFVISSSEEQLAGARAPRTRWLKWILPECGEFDRPCVIVAALYGVHGFVARDTAPVTVQSVGP